MKLNLLLLPILALTLGSVTAAAPQSSATSQYLKNPAKGDPALKSIGPLAFGENGLLLIAEPNASSIVAVDTGDIGPVAKLTAPVEDTASLIASALSATPAQIQIVDMAVNPASGKTYFSVENNAAKKVSIVVVDGSGKAKELGLASFDHVRVTLPAADSVSIKKISDLALADKVLLVTGQSNEEFSSKIFSIPLPLDSSATGSIFSAETFHVSHNKWETKAPITSFVPFTDKGVPCVLGAFACTPIAKFPLKDLSSGANVRGTSVVELGSGNRPLDVFTYTNGTGSWIVTNTQRFKQPYFGPSKFWGVRVSTDLLARNSPEQTNEKAIRRDVKEGAKTDGIEVLEMLQGASQIDKLSNSEMIVLREAGDKLRLEVCPLPGSERTTASR
jgi:hypothetical protein